MSSASAHEVLTRRHLTAGWIGLLLFLTLGIVLEAMHGLRSPWYLDVGNANRRLMWTLGHAHGTLLSLVQLAFVASVRWEPGILGRARGLISWGLLIGQFVMPLGFLLGGLQLRGGEPGPGVLLVPIGAACLLAGVLMVVWNLVKPGPVFRQREVTATASPDSTQTAEGIPPRPRGKRG